MTRVEALIFDLGNVLIDVDVNRCLQHWVKSSPLTLQEIIGLPHQDSAFEQHEIGSLSDKQYFDSIRRKMLLKASDEEIRIGWDAMLGSRIEDTIQLIRLCYQKVSCYVFSNTNASHHAKWGRENPDFYDIFKHLFVSSEIGLRKPDIESYRYVCREIGLSTENVMFFDDRVENIAGAQAAGLQTTQVQDSQDVAVALEKLKLL